MAVKENQGLQIAVMIFFLLVVLLAVMTYFFFRSADEKSREIIRLTEEKQSFSQAANEAQGAANRLKEVIGFQAVDKMPTIEEEVKKDMTAYAAPLNLDENSRQYRLIVKALENKIRSIQASEATAKAQAQDLQERIAKLEAAKDQQIAQYKAELDKITKDAAGERVKFTEERDRVTKMADERATKFDASQKSVADAIAKKDAQLKELGDRLTQLVNLLDQARKRLEDQQPTGTEVADGRVIWVNQRSNVVWINLGQGDDLQRQTKFSVYSSDGGDAVTAEKKGAIEVTRIIDQHMAEARILEDNVSDPILPGDNIYSPIWQRGVQDGFAIAGLLDINGDGRSNRETVRNLITSNGGVIHAELGDDGTLVGRLEKTTKYLIVGDPPEATADPKLIESYSAITAEASNLGIQTIPLQKFLGSVGYRPDERTVPLGTGANPEDFKAKPEKGVIPKSTTPGFQKRTRPRSSF